MSKLQLITPVDAAALCREVAHIAYDETPPTDEYAERVTRLLFMTAAHESGGFKHNRQMGFEWNNGKGAHGVWQCEYGTTVDSCRYLNKHPAMAKRVTGWLFGVGADPKWFNKITRSAILQLIVLDARASCLFARLHYIRINAAVPATDQLRAEYAKRFYNTYLGSALVTDYLNAFNRYWPENTEILG